MKELHCRDTGHDCDGVIRATTEREVMYQAAAHAAIAHGQTGMDDRTIEQIRARIRTV